MVRGWVPVLQWLLLSKRIQCTVSDIYKFLDINLLERRWFPISPETVTQRGHRLYSFQGLLRTTIDALYGTQPASAAVSLCVSLLLTPYCLHSVLQLLTTHPLTQLFVFLFNNDIYMASNLNCSLPLVGNRQTTQCWVLSLVPCSFYYR